jgi:predicted small integral membrane protein
MRTLAFRSTTAAEKRYLVIVHTAATPDALEWQAYTQAVGAAAVTTVDMLHAFVVTDGGGPTSSQRKEIADAFARGSGDAVTHVFTTSAFVRGIVTAFHWMNWSPAVAHHPNDFVDVCRESGLSPIVVWNELASLERELAPIAIMRQIERSMKEALKHAIR